MTILGALLAGCLGSDGSGPVGAAPSSNGVAAVIAATGPEISGVAVKGHMNSSDVNIYEIDSKGKRGKSLGKGKTGSKGEFKFNMDAKPSSHEIEVSGGNYKSESSTITAAKDILCWLMHPQASAACVAIN
jgi:hypothetical protein